MDGVLVFGLIVRVCGFSLLLAVCFTQAEAGSSFFQDFVSTRWITLEKVIKAFFIKKKVMKDKLYSYLSFIRGALTPSYQFIDYDTQTINITLDCGPTTILVL